MNIDIQKILSDQISPEIENLLSDTYDSTQAMGEIVQGVMLFNAASNFSKKTKEAYPRLIMILESKYGNIKFERWEYESKIDQIVNNALSKYIKNIPDSRLDTVEHPLQPKFDSLLNILEKFEEEKESRMHSPTWESRMRSVTWEMTTRAFKGFDPERLDRPISISKSMVIKCKPLLKDLRASLGKSDKMYLNISSRIANVAENTIVEHLNRRQNGERILLIFAVKFAWDVTALIETLDMDSEFTRQHHTRYKSDLKSLCQSLGLDTQDVKQRLESELKTERRNLDVILQWTIFRSKSHRKEQIINQEEKIRRLISELNYLAL